MKQILRRALGKDQAQSDAGVERILDKKLATVTSFADFAPLWDLSAYDLAAVDCVRDAKPEAQNRLRHLLGRARLLEAWAIEKAGMSFAAKMSLLSESINEQKLYSLFGAEEARHFHFIDQTLGEQSASPGDPFIDLLNEIIATAGRRPLLFIIQVVLEGWGIEHYASIQKNCSNPGLKTALREILADEAAHHGSGLALFKENQLTRGESAYILEMMSTFLYMVRIGPVGVLAALEAEFGPWAPGQKQRVLTQMGAHADTRRKLALLEGFLNKAGALKILEKLRKADAFTPAWSES